MDTGHTYGTIRGTVDVIKLEIKGKHLNTLGKLDTYNTTPDSSTHGPNHYIKQPIPQHTHNIHTAHLIGNTYTRKVSTHLTALTIYNLKIFHKNKILTQLSLHITETIHVAQEELH
jgi:hypothetical protein